MSAASQQIRKTMATTSSLGKRNFLVRAAALFGAFAAGTGARGAGFSPSYFERLYHHLPGKAAFGSASPALRTAGRSVVRIITFAGQNGASGILLGDDWMLTASHVIGETLPNKYSALIVTDFDAFFPPEARNFFVPAPEDGFLTVSENDGNDRLDYTLTKIKQAFPQRMLREMPAGLRGASIAGKRGECFECSLIGHPDSGCAAVGRDWAYRTVKHSTVQLSNVVSNDWELILSTTTCGGFSGGAVLDSNFNFVGMVTGQNESAADAVTGRVVSAMAIAENIRSRWPQFKPPGLKDLAPSSEPVTGHCEYPNSAALVFEPTSSAADPGSASHRIAGHQLFPTLAATAVEHVERCVGYIDLLPSNIAAPRSLRSSGTCFRIGRDWILTAKHVFDCPARADTAWISFAYLDERDLEKFSQIPTDQHVRVCQDHYFSSDDRGFSSNGKEISLDYALMKIKWPRSGPYVPSEADRSRHFLVSPELPKVGEQIYVPQHANAESKGWYRPNDPHKPNADPIVRALDSRRVYHTAPVTSGASGAPMLRMNLEQTELAICGLHTNSRNPRCGVDKDERADEEASVRRHRREQNKYLSDTCVYVPYWAETRASTDMDSSFGTSIFAVMRDLHLRHKFDLNQVEGFCNALPYFRDVYLGGAA